MKSNDSYDDFMDIALPFEQYMLSEQHVMKFINSPKIKYASCITISTECGREYQFQFNEIINSILGSKHFLLKMIEAQIKEFQAFIIEVMYSSKLYTFYYNNRSGFKVVSIFEQYTYNGRNRNSLCGSATCESYGKQLALENKYKVSLLSLKTAFDIHMACLGEQSRRSRYGYKPEYSMSEFVRRTERYYLGIPAWQ